VQFADHLRDPCDVGPGQALERRLHGFDAVHGLFPVPDGTDAVIPEGPVKGFVIGEDVTGPERV